MKVGIIGPLEFIIKIKKIIINEFKDIEAINLVYNEYIETPEILRLHQSHLDGVLFSGYIPYEFAKRNIIPIIPWESIPRNGVYIPRVLLEVAQLGTNILNLSFDCYNDYFIYEAYEESGIPIEKLNIYITEDKPIDEHYLDYVYRFHKDNYLRGVSA